MIAVFVVLFASKARRLITQSRSLYLDRTDLRPGNTLCFSAHIVLGVGRWDEGKRQSETIDNKVTTARYPHPRH